MAGASRNQPNPGGKLCLSGGGAAVNRIQIPKASTPSALVASPSSIMKRRKRNSNLAILFRQTDFFFRTAQMSPEEGKKCRWRGAERRNRPNAKRAKPNVTVRALVFLERVLNISPKGMASIAVGNAHGSHAERSTTLKGSPLPQTATPSGSGHQSALTGGLPGGLPGGVATGY